jgi:hypothetical protein
VAFVRRSSRRAFDDRADFDRNDLFDRAPALARLAVRVDCGKDDPFFANVRSLAERAGLASTRFGAGFHDAATWRSFLPGQLEFFRKAL